MKNFNKALLAKLTATLVASSSILSLVSCGKNNDSSSTLISSSGDTYSNSSNVTESIPTSSEEESLDENQIIEELNEDEYVKYGNPPTGSNNDRIVYDETTQPLNIKETYLATFNDLSTSRILIDSVGDYANVSFIQGNDPKSIDGSTALYLESEGDYSGVTFAGLKFTNNATYRVKFDYRVIEASNDFFLQFRSYKAGYSYDVYSTFNGTINQINHFDAYYDLANYSDYKISIFPRNNAGKVVVDNLSITRIYSRPRLANAEIANNGNLQVGDSTSFNYKFEDPNGEFTEESTVYYWYSSLDTSGLNKELLARNSSSITLTSNEDNKYIGVSYKTSNNMSESNEWTANLRQKYSIETSALSISTVGGNAAAISKDHEFTNGVALSTDFESYDATTSNINYFNSGTKSYVYTQKDEVISGNKSLYVESLGFFDGFSTSGYIMKPNMKYEVSFDYKFITKPSSFYVQLRSKTSNNFDVFDTLDISNVNANQIYHYKGEFTTLDRNDYYLQMFGNNDGYIAIFDNLKIVEREAMFRDEEPTTNPSSLNEIGDYVLETFGDTANKVLNYDGTNVVFDETLNSYSYSFTTSGNREIYIPFNNSIIGDGKYCLDIDYNVVKKGTGNFYFSIYVNDFNSDSTEKQVMNLTENSKLHFQMEFSASGKNVTKNLLKVFTYYASGDFEIHFDNVKVTKMKTPTADDPSIYGEVDGGTLTTENSDILGENSMHFVTNGQVNFEKLYIKCLPVLSAGTYTFSFDYCLKQFTTNTMYIAAFQPQGCVKELQDFEVSLNTKHSYSFTFTASSNVSFIRIMTGQVAGIMDIYLNNLSFTKA